MKPVNMIENISRVNMKRTSVNLRTAYSREDVFDMDFKSFFCLTLKQSCLNSTSHGIPVIARSPTWTLKLFWTILFIASVCTSIFFCYKSISAYYQYKVSVSIKLDQETPSTTFPAVTFCNLNPFDSHEKHVSDILHQMMKKHDIKNNFESKKIMLNLEKSLFKLKSLSKQIYADKNQTNLGFRIEKMLLNCEFDGVECGLNDFDHFYSFEYGNCYTFNKDGKNSSTSLKKVIRRKTGLTLELFVGIPGEFTFQKGVFIAIHNNKKIPITKYDGIKIPVGFSTDIALERTFNYRLGPPYNDCRKDVTSYSEQEDSLYYKYIIKNLTETQYSRKLCYEVCYQDLVNKICECNDPSNIVTLNSSYPMCSFDQIFNCVNNVTFACDEQFNKCSCYKMCPSECDWLDYSTSLSSSDYPSEYYFKLMSQSESIRERFPNSNLTLEIYKKSVAMVNIHYSNLVYQNISESPLYEPSDLVGIIGGELGLFIGVSLLSLCEIIDFWINIIEKLIAIALKKKIETIKK